MEFQIIWFVLWGVLWAAYFVLDGFDLGAGVLCHFLAKTESEKRAVLSTIGPVWNGNEVWLITAGGATFAAFPATYASMFSYLYSALLLLLFSLILRGVALEFRGLEGSAPWKRGWDYALLAGSFLPSLLLGVAFGNIFRGLPIDADGYHGSLLYLLNPYGLVTGILFVLLFLTHGSLWLKIKTTGDISERAAVSARRLWYALCVVALSFLIFTYFGTSLSVNYRHIPLLYALPLAALLSLLSIMFFISRKSFHHAFYSSALSILMITATGVAGLYPNLIPSSINPDFSLTIFNSSSSIYTLKIMTVVAFIFVPIVIAYQYWTYRIFRNGSPDLETETYL